VSEVDADAEHHRTRTSDHAHLLLAAVFDCFLQDT
jgi:hypothetical protein